MAGLHFDSDVSEDGGHVMPKRLGKAIQRWYDAQPADGPVGWTKWVTLEKYGLPRTAIRLEYKTTGKGDIEVDSWSDVAKQ